ncbi:hypothetical protein Tco_1554655 [Tanacetum coccineum]
MWEAIERLQQSDPETSSEGQSYAEEFGSHCKDSRNSTNLPIIQPQNSIIHRNKNVVTIPRFMTGQSDWSSWESDGRKLLVGAREMLWSSSATVWDTGLLLARIFGLYAKGMQKAKNGFRDSTYQRKKMLLCWKPLPLHGKDSKGSYADQAMTLSHWEHDDQNDVECDNERAALAILIANLKLDVDDNKKIQMKIKRFKSN